MEYKEKSHKIIEEKSQKIIKKLIKNKQLIAAGKEYWRNQLKEEQRIKLKMVESISLEDLKKIVAGDSNAQI